MVCAISVKRLATYYMEIGSQIHMHAAKIIIDKIYLAVCIIP